MFFFVHCLSFMAAPKQQVGLNTIYSFLQTSTKYGTIRNGFSQPQCFMAKTAIFFYTFLRSYLLYMIFVGRNGAQVYIGWEIHASIPERGKRFLSSAELAFSSNPR